MQINHDEAEFLRFDDEKAHGPSRVLGTLIVNGGGEEMLIPEEELRAIERAGTTPCDHCGTRFEARKGTGGKPQRFCSAKCRAVFHATKEELEAPTKTPPAPAPAPVKATPPPDDDDEFNWSTADVVIPSQPGIAVYFNPRGEVVIRQESQMHPDEDHYVFVQMKNLQLLIDKLCDIAGIGGAP
jgi:hypothetical protein